MKFCGRIYTHGTLINLPSDTSRNKTHDSFTHETHFAVSLIGQITRTENIYPDNDTYQSGSVSKTLTVYGRRPACTPMMLDDSLSAESSWVTLLLGSAR